MSTHVRVLSESYTVDKLVIPALNACAPGHNTQRHAQLQPSLLGTDALKTEHRFDSQATLVIDVFGLLF